MAAASLEQLEYAQALAGLARVEFNLDEIRTKAEASAKIEALLHLVELQPKTRAAVFKTLAGTKFTKADMYEFLGITSMSASGDATEWHGKRAIKWLNGELVETQRIAPVEAVSIPRRPTRFRLPPAPISEHPPGPEVTIREPVEPETRPGVVPSIRRPVRPPPAPIAETPPAPVMRKPTVRMRPPAIVPTFDAIPGTIDEATGEIVPFAPRPAPRASGLSQATIEAITLGATKETAATMLAKLRSLGVTIERAGRRCTNWGIWTTEWSILGLMPPTTPHGLTTNPMATSAWWSRNHPFEEARCAPPF